MELHRLDGFSTSGLDNLDIQDIDYTPVVEELYSIGDLAMLEGLGTTDNTQITHEILDEHGNVVMYADAEENLYMLNGLEGFFKRIGRGLKKASRFVKKAVVRPVKKAAKFVGKKVLKPAFKFFNRFLNPATILLRNGFLLAMKINLFKVAERLRFGYLSEAEARKRGMNMRSFSKLKRVIRKAEKIYEGAGGKSKNLRKAILRGKGNRNKAVPLRGFDLGMLDQDDFADDFERFVIEADVEVVEEFINANDSLTVEGLGEIATGTAIAAASGAVASIGTLLKNIKGVFEKANTAKREVKQFVRPFKSSKRNTPRATLTRSTKFVPNAHLRNGSSNTPFTRGSRNFIPSVTKTQVATSTPFLTKYKTPLLIGAGVIAIGGVYYMMTRKKQEEKQKPVAPVKPVNGLPNKNRKRDALGRFSPSVKKAAIGSRKPKPTKKRLPKKMTVQALL